MGRSILPETIREEIIDLFRKGYTRDSVFQFERDEAQPYVNSDVQLKRCIGRIEQVVPDTPDVRIVFPVAPKSKPFDPKPYLKTIAGVTKNTPLKEIERVGALVAKNILMKYEGFKDIKDVPDFAGTPFDLFGFKKKEPFIIELKASLNSFNYPGEIQKQRMQNLLKRIEGLHVALIQLKFKRAEYRVFYDNQMDLLFYGSKMPLGPIENWIREYI
jgi:hypothetical protein